MQNIGATADKPDLTNFLRPTFIVRKPLAFLLLALQHPVGTGCSYQQIKREYNRRKPSGTYQMAGHRLQAREFECEEELGKKPVARLDSSSSDEIFLR